MSNLISTIHYQLGQILSLLNREVQNSDVTINNYYVAEDDCKLFDTKELIDFLTNQPVTNTAFLTSINDKCVRIINLWNNILSKREVGQYDEDKTYFFEGKHKSISSSIKFYCIKLSDEKFDFFSTRKGYDFFFSTYKSNMYQLADIASRCSAIVNLITSSYPETEPVEKVIYPGLEAFIEKHTEQARAINFDDLSSFQIYELESAKESFSNSTKRKLLKELRQLYRKKKNEYHSKIVNEFLNGYPNARYDHTPPYVKYIRLKLEYEELENKVRQRLKPVENSDDAKYRLFGEPKEFRKYEYESIKRMVQDHGFFKARIKGQNYVNFYSPELAVILTNTNFPANQTNSAEPVLIDSRPFFQSYINGYLEGKEYFKNEFRNKYGNNLEQYAKDVHYNYFHFKDLDMPFDGWHFVKSTHPQIISHDVIRRFGYYSGIVSEVDDEVKRHPSIFKDFEKCEITISKNEKASLKAPVLALFCYLINATGLIKKVTDESVESYCKRVCKHYEFPYTDRVRQNFNGSDVSKTRHELIVKIFPVIDDESKVKIQRHLDDKYPLKQNLYG